MMKKVFKWFSIVSLCFSSISTVHASVDIQANEEAIGLSEKFYISADQIHLNDNKIYVEIDNITYETPAIFSDENGYYIKQVAKSGIPKMVQESALSCVKAPGLRFPQVGPMFAIWTHLRELNRGSFHSAQSRFLNHFRYNCSWYEWKCSKCGYCNLRGLDFECRSCGRSISK